jgi:hypothetical protein
LPSPSASNDVPQTTRPRIRRAPFWTAIALLLGLATASRAEAITLAWFPSPDAAVAGYFVLYGTVPGAYTNSLDVGNATTASVPDLTAGQIYYFAVEAYTADGRFSAPSNVIADAVPGSGTNCPPVLNPVFDQSSVWNASVSLSLSAFDPDGDALTYSAINLPPGLSVNPATGLISGTLTRASAGRFAVNATVSDGNFTSSQTFAWTVKSGPTQGDFDGDAKTDMTVYRPLTGQWFTLDSSTNHTTFSGEWWGISTDTPVPADYDGDGKTDPAVYRPATGQWFVLQSSTNYTTYGLVSWGVNTDVPVPGDYDADGKADPAVYRPSTGQWFILISSTSYTTYSVQAWGINTDIPVPGDYDGDGKTDPAVYRPSTGQWFALESSTNYTTYIVQAWGVSTDVPVPGDYDGDGKTDPAVYRPSTGQWFALESSTSYTTYIVQVWGLSADVPVPGDYDGDGKNDPAVYRPLTGQWFVLQSSTGYTPAVVVSWGLASDTPTPISALP